MTEQVRFVPTTNERSRARQTAAAARQRAAARPTKAGTISTLYYAELPEFMGDGIEALGLTEVAARAAVQRQFLAMRATILPQYGQGFLPWWTWSQACEYFGFTVTKVTIGKAYVGGLRDPYGAD